MSIKKITLILKSKLLSPGFLIPMIINLIILGCKNVEEKQAKTALTMENLQIAYSKEINRQKVYKAFISRAEKERKKEVANLYRALVRSEEIQSSIILNMMKNFGIEPKPVQEELVPIGTTQQTLKMALSMEEIEYSTLYSNIIHCAEIEKHEDCVKQLRIIQDVDAKHAELIRYAIFKGNDFPNLPYTICTACGYILTTEKVEKCPCCKARKDMFEKL